jgi:hypothetical protein
MAPTRLAALGLLLACALLPTARPTTPSDVISGRVTLPPPPAQPQPSGGDQQQQQPPPLPPGARAAAALGAPPSGLDRGARVVLDGGAREAFASALDGSFAFEGVAPGEHTVEVFHRDVLYPSFRVLVPPRGAERAADAVGRYPYPGALRLEARLPLEVAPVALPQWFEERPPSSLWGLARSPMVWMGGVMLVLMVMMRGIDPEEMK